MTTVDAIKLAKVRRLTVSGEARGIRLQHRLSLAEVASACGVKESTVWRWERGKNRPVGAPALVYADLLDELRQLA